MHINNQSKPLAGRVALPPPPALRRAVPGDLRRRGAACAAFDAGGLWEGATGVLAPAGSGGKP